MGVKKTILVADDERMLRKALHRVLSRAGYDVLLASDGQEAVQLFSEHEERIDLVILDMNMPRMNGVEACRAIKGLAPEAKVLLASGENRSEVLAHFTQQAPHGVLQKPFELREFVADLRHFIEN